MDTTVCTVDTVWCMTSHPKHPPGDDVDLVRVTVMLPRWLVAILDGDTYPGRSRGAVCRELLTDAVREKAA